MTMSDHGDANSVRRVTPELLASWQLPAPGDSKYSRGAVVVIGGSESAPGAAMLAGLSALRVGAGRLTLIIPEAIAIPMAVAIPEAGVLPTPTGEWGDSDRVRPELEDADAVLVGPGLDDADETTRILGEVLSAVSAECLVVLDAFALGVLPALESRLDPFAGRLVLTPNKEEAARLLDQQSRDPAGEVATIARRFGAAVSCYGRVADADGGEWSVEIGDPGLGTSGSGDVLAGAVLGLCGRGAPAAHAAVWGTYVHALAGKRLADTIAPLGFLASELSSELASTLASLDG
jgi:ADP-dependent NAD(P)H-hydrate dehydratase